MVVICWLLLTQILILLVCMLADEKSYSVFSLSVLIYIMF